MTVLTTKSSQIFPGNGVATIFPCSFRIFDDTDVEVSLVNQTSGTATPLVLNSDYTIAGAGDSNGFTLSTTNPVVTGINLYVQRAIAYEQPTDFTNQGSFFPTMHEDMADRLSMQIQQLVDVSSRAVSMPGGLDPAPSSQLPPPLGGSLLGWSADGSSLVNTGPSGVGAGSIADINVASGAAIQSGKLQDTSSLAGAVPQSLRAIFGQMPSLKTFGAVGDGVHDDTAAIQLAMNTIGLLGGGVLDVPDGTYLVSSRIFVNYSNVVLRGRSRYSNTFKAANNASGISIHGMFEVVAGVSNFGMVEVGADGNIANNTAQGFGAIYTQGNNVGVVVERCYLRNFIYSTIFFNSSGGSNSNSNFRIVGNRIENCGWDGICVFYGYFGDISENTIVSTGQNGIRTDGVSGQIGPTSSQNITINGNRITKATPPTALNVAAGGIEGGFMIVFGAGDQNIVVDGNDCFDNRNAKQDGIGLGQDGTHNNAGCVVSNNSVTFAGLFGIDATQNSSVVGNVIRFANQCGIKLGTDHGGTANNIVIADNIIYNANSGATPGQQGIWVASAIAGSTYTNVSITGNTVVDDRAGAAQTTLYGLTIDFTNVTYTNCSFFNNNFRQVKTAGVQTIGTMPAAAGWTWRGNLMKGTPVNDFAIMNGATPSVFGYENFQEVNGGAITITNFLGGYDGMRFRVQHNDANATYQFAGGSNLVGNGGVNITVSGNGVWDWWRFNGNWYGVKVN